MAAAAAVAAPEARADPAPLFPVSPEDTPLPPSDGPLPGDALTFPLTLAIDRTHTWDEPCRFSVDVHEFGSLDMLFTVDQAHDPLTVSRHYVATVTFTRDDNGRSVTGSVTADHLFTFGPPLNNPDGTRSFHIDVSSSDGIFYRYMVPGLGLVGWVNTKVYFEITYGADGTQLVRKTINRPGYKGVGPFDMRVCGLLAPAHARVLGFALGDKAEAKPAKKRIPAGGRMATCPTKETPMSLYYSYSGLEAGAQVIEQWRLNGRIVKQHIVPHPTPGSASRVAVFALPKAVPFPNGVYTAEILLDGLARAHAGVRRSC